jgi:hypothetical protein
MFSSQTGISITDAAEAEGTRGQKNVNNSTGDCPSIERIAAQFSSLSLLNSPSFLQYHVCPFLGFPPSSLGPSSLPPIRG